jgi:fido (protein-threonine AMPylation protein)
MTGQRRTLAWLAMGQGRYTSQSMFRRWRLKKIHAKFLESCRTLDSQRAYWNQASSLTRWFLETITPAPLLSLHSDGKSLLDALQWLEGHCKKCTLGETELRQYHKLIFSGGEELPGEYRTYDVIMKDSKFKPPPFQRVPLLMRQLDLTLAHDQEAFDKSKPVDPASLFRVCADIYQRIGLIHPFGDGNGRVARLAMNHLLRRYDMGYVILPHLGEEPKLWDALQMAHGGQLDLLIEFSRKCLHPI